MGAEAGAGKNLLKKSPRSQAFLEPEPIKEIYKNGSIESGARSFLEGAGEKKVPAPQHWTNLFNVFTSEL